MTPLSLQAEVYRHQNRARRENSGLQNIRQLDEDKANERLRLAHEKQMAKARRRR